MVKPVRSPASSGAADARAAPAPRSDTTSRSRALAPFIAGCLDLLGHDERRAVRPGQELVRLRIVHELLGGAVEGELAAHAVRDVAEVGEGRGQVALLDVAGEHLAVAGPDRVDPVLVVRG